MMCNVRSAGIRNENGNEKNVYDSGVAVLDLIHRLFSCPIHWVYGCAVDDFHWYNSHYVGLEIRFQMMVVLNQRCCNFHSFLVFFFFWNPKICFYSIPSLQMPNNEDFLKLRIDVQRNLELTPYTCSGGELL